MRLRLLARPRLARRCAVCKSLDGHTTACPHGQLEVLRDQQRWIHCPTCEEDEVDINQSDLYECRKCHTLYSSGAAHEQPESRIVYLDDSRKSGLIPVVILPQKGKGQFVADCRIKEIQQRLARAKKRSRARSQ